MVENQPLKVVIIGGGLVAPMLALCLKKQDINSEIYEMREFESDDIGNIALSPNACRVLDYVGLYGYLRKIGYEYGSGMYLDMKCRMLLGTKTADSESRFGYAGLIIKRHILRNALRKEAEGRGVQIHYEMKCVGVQKSDDGDGVAVSFANGEIVKADCVIGADGVHSLVRKYIYPDLKAEYKGLTAITGPVDPAKMSESCEVPKSLVFQIGWEGTFVMCYCDRDCTEATLMGHFQLPDQSREDWQKLAENKQEMKRMLVDSYDRDCWPHASREAVKAVDPELLILWPFYRLQPLPHFVSPDSHVIIIGDAAHAMPPTSGQGTASGFEDAATLALAMSRDSKSQPLPDRLQKWEQHRIEHVKTLYEDVDLSIGFWTRSATMWQQMVKEWMLWATWQFFSSGFRGRIAKLYLYNVESVIKDLKS